MTPRPWELIVGDLGEAAWDAATELASMIADEQYPTLLDDGYRHRQAAYTVVKLVTDPDYRACVENLLALSRPTEPPATEEPQQ